MPLTFSGMHHESPLNALPDGLPPGRLVTPERGSDSPQVNFRGIQDERGRLMVVMAHNTDIPDTWEREGESKEYFDRFSPNGYAVGVNIMIYAMTH